MWQQRIRRPGGGRPRVPDDQLRLTPSRTGSRIDLRLRQILLVSIGNGPSVRALPKTARLRPALSRHSGGAREPRGVCSPRQAWRREERLRGAAGEVAGQPLPGSAPRSGRCGRSRSRRTPGRSRSAGTGRRFRFRRARPHRVPTPRSSPPRTGSRGDAHADELARLGRHIGQQVHRGLREAEPRPAAGHLAVGGPEPRCPWVVERTSNTRAGSASTSVARMMDRSMESSCCSGRPGLVILVLS